MPTSPPSSAASTIPWQVLPNGNLPYVQQQNFGQMIGEVLFWNPSVATKAPIWLNASARKIYDRRTWFGLMINGQLVCPGATTTGSATVTTGLNTIVGTNTSWTAALIGQQFRIGYNNPIYTISDVDPIGQTLQLQLPWGGPSSTSGYFIVQYYYNLGPNIKYLYSMVNMQLGYKFKNNLTQNWLNAVDPWRQNQNFPWAVSPFPLDPSGNYLVELYPASWIQQAFPFLAYVQPPNLVNDNDTLPAYIRSDVVVKDVISKALVIGGPKNNPYYDAVQSQRFAAEFEGELVQMANADENLYRINISLAGEDLPYYNPGGALWDAQHAVMGANNAYGGDW